MAVLRSALPDALKYSAAACAARRTLSNVYVSAIVARQPSVPNWITRATRVSTPRPDRLQAEDAHAVTPVFEQVAHRLIERAQRLPVCRCLELVDIAPQQSDVARADARRV